MDSGRGVSEGYADFDDTYRQMLDSALAAPAAAAIDATWWRDGDRVSVAADVTNLGATPLGPENNAKVYAIVYENNQVRLTHRFVRAELSAAIGDEFNGPQPALDLAPGARASYTLVSDELAGVDWDKLDVAVIVDYLPDVSGPYLALQSGVATRISRPLALSTNLVALLADPDAEQPGAARRQTVFVAGSAGMTWTATVDVPWLTLTPASGSTNITVEIAGTPDAWFNGWQAGAVTFTAAGRYEQVVRVMAYRGEVDFLYLPSTTK